MLLNSKHHINRCGAEVKYDLVYCSITLHVYRNISQQLFIIKQMYLIHFLSFYTVKTIDVTDGFCEIT